MVKNINITLSDKLRAEMDKYPEVRWSQVAAEGVRKYIEERSGLV